MQNMAESPEVEAQWMVELMDLPILRHLGRGPSGYFYETTCGGKKRARVDFPLGSAERNSVFEREVKKVCKLDDHPNVVKCFGYTLGRNICSLVQEYVADNLQNSVQRRIDQEVIRKRGTSTPGPSRVLNPDEIEHLLTSRGKEMEKGEMKVADAGAFEAVPEAVDIISQIATGMRYLHENWVVHGDLKPRNVLVLNSDQSGGWKVKLADYGLTETKKRIRMVSERTRRAEILTWKAPECLGTKNLNHGSLDDDCLTESDTDSDEETEVEFLKSKLAMADVYSFGLICSYILGGKPMSSDMSLTQSLQQRIEGFKPKPLASASLEDLKLVIGACLESEPLKRPTFSMICRMELAPSLLRLQVVPDVTEGRRRESVPQIPSEVPVCLQDSFDYTPKRTSNIRNSQIFDIEGSNCAEVFPMAAGDERFNRLAMLKELPHEKIEVKIRLQQALLPWQMFELARNLEQNSMNVVTGAQRNIIIVSGIPSRLPYDDQSVLAEVERFEKGAKLFSEEEYIYRDSDTVSSVIADTVS